MHGVDDYKQQGGTYWGIQTIIVQAGELRDVWTGDEIVGRTERKYNSKPNCSMDEIERKTSSTPVRGMDVFRIGVCMCVRGG